MRAVAGRVVPASHGRVGRSYGAGKNAAPVAIRGVVGRVGYAVEHAHWVGSLANGIGLHAGLPHPAVAL